MIFPYFKKNKDTRKSALLNQAEQEEQEIDLFSQNTDIIPVLSATPQLHIKLEQFNSTTITRHPVKHFIWVTPRFMVKSYIVSLSGDNPGAFLHKEIQLNSYREAIAFIKSAHALSSSCEFISVLNITPRIMKMLEDLDFISFPPSTVVDYSSNLFYLPTTKRSYIGKGDTDYVREYVLNTELKLTEPAPVTTTYKNSLTRTEWQDWRGI